MNDIVKRQSDITTQSGDECQCKDGMQGPIDPPGQKGDEGKQGRKGDAGPPGNKGDIGEQGLKGTKGKIFKIYSEKELAYTSTTSCHQNSL